MTLSDLISEERLREIADEACGRDEICGTMAHPSEVLKAARLAALEAARAALEAAAMKAELSWERALTGPDIRALSNGLKE